jgi:DNA replication protein DnaC
MTTLVDLRTRAQKLGLVGLLDHWDEVEHLPWVSELLTWEEQHRQRRSLERRIRSARLPRFRPMTEFDWAWPKAINQPLVRDLMGLRFINEGANAILIGPNGVGKSMIAFNIAHQALLHGHSVMCTNASQMLNSLAACETAAALERRLRALARPSLLLIDELGYLSYDNRYADLLFQVVSRRYAEKSILITSNKEFAQWSDAFPNATTVVTLVDRLVHHAEIVNIEGESYRLKEARERTERRKRPPAKAITAALPASD